MQRDPLDRSSPRHAPVRRPRSSRLLAAAWIVGGLVAVTLGNAYASGLPTIGGTTASDEPVATRTVDLSGAPPSASLYGDAVTSFAPLAYSWSGRWGAIAADHPLFYVDLTGHSGTFAAEVVLVNGGELANWYSLQLELEVAAVADEAACQALDFDGTQAPQVLYAETLDASVTFTGLDAAQKWCIGIASSDGKDTSGTYLRRASTGSTPTYPTFVAALAQTS